MFALLGLLVVCAVIGSAVVLFARRARAASPVEAPPPPRPKVEAAPSADRYAPRALLLVGEEHAAQLEEAVTLRTTRVKSAQDLVEQAAGSYAAVAIVDLDLLPHVRAVLPDIPVIALLDGEPSTVLAATVRALDNAPALSSVITAKSVTTPEGRKHLAHVLKRLTAEPSHDVLGDSSTGRMAKLAQASHREARFERMREYFTGHGVSPRALTAIGDVAEELVMNALYNAPTEAGFFDSPVSRTEDVTLPPKRACSISYGMDGDNVFVRVRDTFGSLDRARLLEVLARCSSQDVTLDESRGGAGLGMWRIFSAASAIAVTVIPDQVTDIVVRLPKNGRSRQLMGVHLFFAPRSENDPFQFDTTHSSLVDRSITMIHQA